MTTLTEYKKRFGIEREFYGNTNKKLYRLLYNGQPASNWEDARNFIVSMREEYIDKFKLNQYEFKL